MAGVPAVAMSYLANEVGPAGVGAAIGTLIAGNSAGGMIGRLVAGIGVDWLAWRGALAAVAVLGVACAVVVAVSLPPDSGPPSRAPRGLRNALRDRVLLCQYAIAALAVSAFARSCLLYTSPRWSSSPTPRAVCARRSPDGWPTGWAEARWRWPRSASPDSAPC